MSKIPIGSTDSARTAEAVIVVNRATGEPAGTSDTTEATQLLVKAAVESIASPYIGAVAITPGSPVTPGVGVFIACTVAGNVRLKLANDSVLDVPVAVGATMIDDMAVKDVVAGGTTATAVVSVLVRA